MELKLHQKRQIVEFTTVERKVIQKKLEDYASRHKIEAKEKFAQDCFNVIKPLEKLVVKAFLCSIEQVNEVKKITK